MKKIKILLIIFLSFSFFGCAKEKENISFDELFGDLGTQISVTPSQSSKNEEAVSDSEQNEPMENKIITMKTNFGDIKIEIFLEKMPVTAGNFLKLAENDFYNGTTFHRVIKNFMIQGGDPLSKDNNPANDGTGGPGYFIKDEFNPEFSNKRGYIAMANAGPNTGGSQFFINTVDNIGLDPKHPVFGIVLEGMDIVDKITEAKTDGNDRPLENITIQSIVVE